MSALWFAILALMLTAYAVLDGFDFGVGIVHLFVARTDEERKTCFAAIGPVWDGNEVWLIASGGVLVFAFPRAYAAAFSGLYLPLMLVLWLIILRGISIEFRGAVANPLWAAAWDVVFAFSSACMAAVLGVALGNLIRGVPLGPSGYFHEDLFAGSGGALDPYTVLTGLFALVTLGAHGATYLVWKTRDGVHTRSKKIAVRLWTVALVLALVVTVVTVVGQPVFFAQALARPWLLTLPALALLSGGLAVLGIHRGHELFAFLASSAFVALLLFSTAGALFPVILRSTVDPAFTLDVYNAATAHSALATGLALMTPGLVLAVMYFVYLFRSMRGKVSAGGGH